MGSSRRWQVRGWLGLWSGSDATLGYDVER
jgi:hypothetical protein